jgi:hypothetical protein
MNQEFNQSFTDPSSGVSTNSQSNETQDFNTPDVNTPPSTEDVTKNTPTQEVNPVETQPVQQEQSVNQSLDTQNTPRTAAQFYREIANQVTEETPQKIRDVSAQKEEQMQEKAKIGEERLAVNKEQGHTSPLKIRQNLELRKEGKALEKVDEAQRQKIMQTNAQLQNLRSPAEELNANIASDKEVARTIEPRRLEELAEANEPLPGQEAAVRMVDQDLTSEQIAERKAQLVQQREARIRGEYKAMPLPTDSRTESEKQQDLLSQEEEYKEIGIQRLSSNLLDKIQRANEGINEKNQKSIETIVSWNVDPTVIELFSKRAYELNRERVVTNSDLGEGYLGVRNEIKQLEDQYPRTPDIQNQIDYLKETAEEIRQLEKEALRPLIIFQMGNEIAQAIGEEPLDPNQFIQDMERISASWREKGSDIAGHYLKQCGKYRRVDQSYRERVLKEVGGVSNLGAGTYPEGIVQDIADISRTSVLNLSTKNLPTIMAYFSIGLERGTDPVDYDNFTYGIEMALQHALKNSFEDPSMNNFPSLMDKIRERYYGVPRTFEDLTKPYASMMFSIGDFNTQSKFLGRDYFR